MIQGAGLFVCYFVVFNEFGITPQILNKLLLVPYFHHNPSDVYDISHPTLGNTNLICDGSVLKSKDNFGRNATEDGNLKGNTIDWLFL